MNTPAKVGFTNGFRAMATLRKAAADPRVAEIEGEGMDDGRVFVHLADGYWFRPPYSQQSRSVGSASELRDALALIEPKPGHQARAAIKR